MVSATAETSSATGRVGLRPIVLELELGEPTGRPVLAMRGRRLWRADPPLCRSALSLSLALGALQVWSEDLTAAGVEIGMWPI